MDYLQHGDDDEEHMLLTAEDDGDDSTPRSTTPYDCITAPPANQGVDAPTATIKDAQDYNSSDMEGASSDSELDSSSMTTSSSSHSSRSWEILDRPEADTTCEVDTEALAAAAAETDSDEPSSPSGLVESVSRDAKQMFDGIKMEMKDISDGYSMIASGVDKVTTGFAVKLNKVFVEGAKSAESAVSSLKRDLFEDKDTKENKNANKSQDEKLDSEGNKKPEGKLSASGESGGLTGASSSGSAGIPKPLQVTPSQEDNKVDNVAKDNPPLRKITSVIHNNSSMLPINLRALHTEGLFSPTSEYPAPSQAVSTEISYCGPGEQMIIETQQNDPFDPIAVLVVYEIINVKSKESVGFLRLQAVWHCFEPTPRVGVSLGTEPTPSADGDTVNSLDVADGIRLRCVTKQLDAADGDYFVQSITVQSEEIGSIAMVGKSFEKLIQRFKAF